MQRLLEIRATKILHWRSSKLRSVIAAANAFLRPFLNFDSGGSRSLVSVCFFSTMFDALWRYDLDSQNTIMFGEVSLPGSADSSSCSWKYSPMTYLQVQIPWHGWESRSFGGVSTWSARLKDISYPFEGTQVLPARLSSLILVVWAMNMRYIAQSSPKRWWWTLRDLCITVRKDSGHDHGFAIHLDFRTGFWICEAYCVQLSGSLPGYELWSWLTG